MPTEPGTSPVPLECRGGDKTPRPSWLSLRPAQARAQGTTWARSSWHFPGAKRKFTKRQSLNQSLQGLRADRLAYKKRSRGAWVRVTAMWSGLQGRWEMWEGPRWVSPWGGGGEGREGAQSSHCSPPPAAVSYATCVWSLGMDEQGWKHSLHQPGWVHQLHLDAFSYLSGLTIALEQQKWVPQVPQRCSNCRLRLVKPNDPISGLETVVIKLRGHQLHLLPSTHAVTFWTITGF